MKSVWISLVALAGTCLPCLADSLQDGIESYDKKDYPTAIQMFQTRIKELPQDSVAHYYLATTYIKTNQIGPGVDEYKVCLKLNNNKPVCDDARIALSTLQPAGSSSVTTTTTTTTTAPAAPPTSYADQLKALTNQLMKQHEPYLKERQADLQRMFATIDQQMNDKIARVPQMDVAVAGDYAGSGVTSAYNSAVQRVRDAAARKKQWYQDEFDREKQMLKSEERLNAEEQLRQSSVVQTIK